MEGGGDRPERANHSPGTGSGKGRGRNRTHTLREEEKKKERAEKTARRLFPSVYTVAGGKQLPVRRSNRNVDG